MLTLVSFSVWAAGVRRATTVPPALTHQLVDFLALLGGNRLVHGQTIVDRGFLQGQSRGADFLQLAVDRGAIWLVGFEQVLQVDPLHLKVCPVANLCFAEVRLLLADRTYLFGGDTELLPNGRVFQKACETEFPSPPAETAPAHAFAAAEATLPMAPLASLFTWAAGPHLTVSPEATPSSLLLRWRILWVALRQNRGGAKRHCQNSKSRFRVNFHDVFSRIVLCVAAV